jgi:hypothetical protein
MTMMLEAQFALETRIGSRVQCPLCLEDPTMSEEAKAKKWIGGAPLAHHMGSVIHSGSQAFQRQAEADKEEHVENLYACIYCEQIAPHGEKVPTYKSMKDLIRHINWSNNEKLAKPTGKDYVWMKERTAIEAHDERKAEDGWYEPDWKGNIERKATQQHDKISRAVSRAGIRYAPLPELSNAIPHESRPGLVRGSFRAYEIPSHYSSSGVLAYGDRMEIDSATMARRGLKYVENVEAGYYGIPPHLEGILKYAEE